MGQAVIQEENKLTYREIHKRLFELQRPALVWKDLLNHVMLHWMAKYLR